MLTGLPFLSELLVGFYHSASVLLWEVFLTKFHLVECSAPFKLSQSKRISEGFWIPSIDDS